MNSLERIISKLILMILLFLNSTGFAESVDGTQNAAELYLKAGSLLPKFPENFTKIANEVIENGWRENAVEIKEILASNQEAMSIFKESTKLTNCDFSVYNSIIKASDWEIPLYSANMISLSRLIILEGRFYEKENKLDLGFENYLAIVKLNNHLAQQKDFLLVNMTARIIVENMLYVPLEEYINQQERLSIQNYRTLLSALIALQNNNPEWESVLKAEANFAKGLFNPLLYEKLMIKYYVSFSKLNVLITAVSIKLYELEKRTRLYNLQELVPAYLSKLPEDPFDNFKPLKHIKKENGWAIYSIGPDRQDDYASFKFNEDVSGGKGDIVFQSF